MGKFTAVSPSSPLSRLRTVFLVLAAAEAVSWACLLTGMYFKYLAADPTEVGVQIFGPIHGALFVAYALACLNVRKPFGWTTRTTLIALACAVPPFCTAIFEVTADRRGLLGRQTRVLVPATG